MSGGDLRRVRDQARKFRTRHLSAYFAASDLPYCRAVVIVGKHGHTIVDRNRLRRRLRELVRLNLLPACSGTDIVLHTVPEAYDADMSVLAVEVETLSAKVTSWGRDQ